LAAGSHPGQLHQPTDRFAGRRSEIRQQNKWLAESTVTSPKTTADSASPFDSTTEWNLLPNKFHQMLPNTFSVSELDPISEALVVFSQGNGCAI